MNRAQAMASTIGMEAAQIPAPSTLDINRPAMARQSRVKQEEVPMSKRPQDALKYVIAEEHVIHPNSCITRHGAYGISIHSRSL